MREAPTLKWWRPYIETWTNTKITTENTTEITTNKDFLSQV